MNHFPITPIRAKYADETTKGINIDEALKAQADAIAALQAGTAKVYDGGDYEPSELESDEIDNIINNHYMFVKFDDDKYYVVGYVDNESEFTLAELSTFAIVTYRYIGGIGDWSYEENYELRFTDVAKVLHIADCDTLSVENFNTIIATGVKFFTDDNDITFIVGDTTSNYFVAFRFTDDGYLYTRNYEKVNNGTSYVEFEYPIGNFATKDELPVGFDGEIESEYLGPGQGTKVTGLENYTDNSKVYKLVISGTYKGIALYSPVSDSYGKPLTIITEKTIQLFGVDSNNKLTFVQDYGATGTKWYKHFTIIKGSTSNHEYALTCISTSSTPFTSVSDPIRVFEFRTYQLANDLFISCNTSISYQGQNIITPSIYHIDALSDYRYFSVYGPYGINLVSVSATADLTTGAVTSTQTNTYEENVTLVDDTVTAL